MAKTRKTLIHIHSNVAGKAPSPEILSQGEIAINYAKGTEKLYIKNSDNKIVQFMTEEQADATYARDPKHTEQRLSDLEKIVSDNEATSASRLNEINDIAIMVSNKLDEINGKII